MLAATPASYNSNSHRSIVRSLPKRRSAAVPASWKPARSHSRRGSASSAGRGQRELGIARAPREPHTFAHQLRADAEPLHIRLDPQQPHACHRRRDTDDAHRSDHHAFLIGDPAHLAHRDRCVACNRRRCARASPRTNDPSRIARRTTAPADARASRIRLRAVAARVTSSCCGLPASSRSMNFIAAISWSCESGVRPFEQPPSTSSIAALSSGA